MKYTLTLIALFLLGIVTGYVLLQTGDEPADAQDRAGPSTRADERPLIAQQNPFRAVREASPERQRIERLEQQVSALDARLAGIEERLEAIAVAGAPPPEAEAAPGAASVTAAETLLDRVLTTDNLVKAGIDWQRARDIINRKNRIDFMKLELQDRAIREGYLGTRRYRDELAELTAQEVDLREELGEDDYDRFLFATGQRNRVTATSVMQGSPADQAGIRSGDVILSYNGQRLFDWDELKSATTSGERGQYVNITILRDGQQITLPIPRGPLGVRLGSARIEPIN